MLHNIKINYVHLSRNFHRGKFNALNKNRFNYYEMKKLVLFAAFVAAVAFSACSSKTEAPAVEEQAVVEEVAEVAEAVADSAVAEGEVAVEEVAEAAAEAVAE